MDVRCHQLVDDLGQFGSSLAAGTLHGGEPFRVLLSLQSGFVGVTRSMRLNEEAPLCSFLNSGDNHPSCTVKIFRASAALPLSVLYSPTMSRG